MRTVVTLMLLALVSVVSAQNTQSQKARPNAQVLRMGIAVYDRADYEGGMEMYVRDVPDLARSRLGDDAARSVRVARGCRARLYQETGFGGKYAEINRDTPSLKDTPVGMSQASSVQVRCGGAAFDDAAVATGSKTEQAAGAGAAAPEPETGVTLFTEPGWKGTSRNVQNAVPDLKATPVGYDARSIRIADGCSVQLFAGTNFSGEMQELFHSASNLGATRARSLNVRCGSVAAGLAPAQPAARPDTVQSAVPPVPKLGVTLFDTPNYQNRSETFVGDVPDMRRSTLGDDVARSITVAEGCYVELYELANYRGNRAYVDGNLPTLVNTPVGNQTVSSLRVQCNVNPCANLGPGVVSCVSLYSDVDYGGQSETYQDNVPDLRRTNLGDRRASSLRVSNGCTVELFSQPDYGGDSQSFTHDEPRLDRSGFGANRASSMRFYCGVGSQVGGAGVTLYEHRDFGGLADTFSADVRDLSGTRIGLDRASSAQVDAGCRAWLYNETEFRGQYSLIERDEPRLGDLAVGNDRVRSLRVDCRL